MTDMGTSLDKEPTKLLSSSPGARKENLSPVCLGLWTDIPTTAQQTPNGGRHKAPPCPSENRSTPPATKNLPYKPPHSLDRTTPASPLPRVKSWDMCCEGAHSTATENLTVQICFQIKRSGCSEVLSVTT